MAALVSPSLPRRRAFLRAALSCSALAGLGGLAACTVSTSGSTTTITLNVAKIVAYAQAGLNAAATITAYLGGFASLATYVATISAAETALSTALTAFSTAAGSSITIEYDDASWKTRVDSILSAIETLATAIGQAITAAGSLLSTSVQSAAQSVVSAIQTVISLFKALLSTTVSATAQPMTEAQALHVLGVSR